MKIRVTDTYKNAPFEYVDADTKHAIAHLVDPFKPRYASVEDAVARNAVIVFEEVNEAASTST